MSKATMATVTIEGLDELRLKLTDIERLKRPLYMLLKDTTDVGKAAAEEAIDGGTGVAVRSIGARIDPMYAEVYSNIARERAESIHEGRPPGKPPSLVALARWHTGSTRVRSLGELTRDRIAEVRATQQAIRAGGAKGKQFLQRARERMQDELPRLLGDMARRVQEAFKR